MRPHHIALAVLIAAIWGFNFTVIRTGLDGMPPLLLNALRFTLAGLPALFLPRPAMPWWRLGAIAATLFFGQFVFLLNAMVMGLPAGLASIVLQSQALFTIMLAALWLRERPSPRQLIGLALTVCGLLLIAITAGGRAADVTAIGLILCLAGALSWAAGNLFMRGAPAGALLSVVTWASLLVAGPFFLLSFLIDGRETVATVLSHLDAPRIGAVLYLACIATIIGYSLWGMLLRIYPASTVAPFSLLVPVFGMASATIFLGEQFGPLRLAGAALLLAGLAVIVVPKKT